MSCSRFCIVAALSSGMALYSTDVTASEGEADIGEGASSEVTDSNTVVYDETFISQQSGVVTVYDLIQRIPGGSVLVSQGQSNQRGFSNGLDRILINGRRMSGKENDSNTMLRQISVDRVVRIEVIRGSSPDIKVSSQDALINIVLTEEDSGSGAWDVNGFQGEGGEARFYGGISYNGTKGIMDYSLSVKTRNVDVRDRFDTLFTDDANAPIKRSIEVRPWDSQNLDLRGGLTFNLSNGDQLTLNGLFSDSARTHPRTGTFYLPGSTGELTVPGQSEIRLDVASQKWEVGSDYSKALSSSLDLKVLALYTRQDSDSLSSADYDIATTGYDEDFRSTSDDFSSEAILRSSLIWQKDKTNQLEFGTEIAINKQVVGFEYFLNQNGELVQLDIDASDVAIKETRNESFVIHSWQVSKDISLDSSLFFEYSRLSQSGGTTKARTFKYFKPSFDLRYNLSKNDQMQLSLRRRVSQLNFGDFASSVNDENDVTGGNSNLEPERLWEIETSFEHRLPNDNGYIKPIFLFQRYENKLQQIEVSPGISGVGNGGVGTRYKATIDGALRLYFVGLPNLQISGNLYVQKTVQTDDFTGIKVPFDYETIGMSGTVSIRHDLPGMGISWGVRNDFQPRSEFRDYDEVRLNNMQLPVYTVVFVEKQIIGDIVARFTVGNVFDMNYLRERNLYAGGRADGVIASREHRDSHWSRRYLFTIRGTF